MPARLSLVVYEGGCSLDASWTCDISTAHGLASSIVWYQPTSVWIHVSSTLPTVPWPLPVAASRATPIVTSYCLIIVLFQQSRISGCPSLRSTPELGLQERLSSVRCPRLVATYGSPRFFFLLSGSFLPASELAVAFASGLPG